VAGHRGGGLTGAAVNRQISAEVPAGNLVTRGTGGNERSTTTEPDQEERRPASVSTSTITLVDFTTAVAATPGASSISSAASRLISETIR
jgi:hypothetical protein